MGHRAELNLKFAAHVVHCFMVRSQAAFELGVFYGAQDFFEARAGIVTGFDQVLASDEGGGTDGFGGDGAQLLLRVGVGIELSVAGEAVDAVEFEVLVEGGQTEEFFQSGLVHALYLSETHVMVDEGENLIGVVVREAETAEDLGGHFYSDIDVAVETDAVGRDAEGGRLADVVEKRSPGQSF
jgi:hypothetical protein